jgi:hypothetical protein
MWSTILFLALVTLPAMAIFGKWYRGVYMAITFACGIMMFLFFLTMGLPTNTQSQTGHVMNAFLLFLMLTIGGVFASLLYRRSVTSHVTTAPK